MSKNKYRLKTALILLTLIVSVWALVVAYQAKNMAEWVNDKQDNVIEELLFKNR